MNSSNSTEFSVHHVLTKYFCPENSGLSAHLLVVNKTKDK